MAVTLKLGDGDKVLPARISHYTTLVGLKGIIESFRLIPPIPLDPAPPLAKVGLARSVTRLRG